MNVNVVNVIPNNNNNSFNYIEKDRNGMKFIFIFYINFISNFVIHCVQNF